MELPNLRSKTADKTWDKIYISDNHIVSDFLNKIMQGDTSKIMSKQKKNHVTYKLHFHYYIFSFQNYTTIHRTNKINFTSPLQNSQVTIQSITVKSYPNQV